MYSHYMYIGNDNITHHICIFMFIHDTRFDTRNSSRQITFKKTFFMLYKNVK